MDWIIGSQTLDRWSEFWSHGQDFFGRSDRSLARAPDVGQFFAKFELHQVVANELARGKSTAFEIVKVPRPGHEFESDHVRIGFAVGDPFGHDVQVTIPSDAMVGSSDTVTITVSGTGGATDSSLLTTEVSSMRLFLPIIVKV